jgi:hypothetical protein
MAGQATPQEISRSESIGSWKLWFGALGGPVAWLTHLVVGYSTEEWFACSPSATDVGEILGLSVHQFVIIITVAAALVAAASGVVSFSCLRRIPSATGDESRRARWMAVAGIMNSVLYLLIILGGTAPAVILDICETSP